MTRGGVERARAVAMAFVYACDEQLAAIDTEVAARHRLFPINYPDTKKSPRDRIDGKASGTLRRRSMDLTRALADLRRP